MPADASCVLARIADLYQEINEHSEEINENIRQGRRLELERDRLLVEIKHLKSKNLAYEFRLTRQHLSDSRVRILDRLILALEAFGNPELCLSMIERLCAEEARLEGFARELSLLRSRGSIAAPALLHDRGDAARIRELERENEGLREAAERSGLAFSADMEEVVDRVMVNFEG